MTKPKRYKIKRYKIELVLDSVIPMTELKLEICELLDNLTAYYEEGEKLISKSIKEMKV